MKPAKFENAMNKIRRTVGSRRDTTAASDAYFRINEKWPHSIVTSARLSSPEIRISRNQSQKNADESLESFTPADGTVNYLHLGPVYKSLAPTPWVSMPKPDTGNGPVCAWGGVLPGCKVADAVALAVSLNENAIKSARSLPDERVELAADITFDNFLKARVEVLPQSALSRLSDAIRQEIIPPTSPSNRTARSAKSAWKPRSRRTTTTSSCVTTTSSRGRRPCRTPRKRPTQPT